MTSIVNKYVLLFLFLAMPITMTVCAQSITPQKLVFSKICAGSFNGFDATFNYSGFPSGTTFEVQLSDSSGSFATPIGTTIISTTDVSASQKKIRFSVPPTLIGSENYKLRVKSSTGFFSLPFLNNASNASFAVYFKAYENSFSINKKENTATLCTGGSIAIVIDDTTSPELKYKWYKDNVLIAGATTTSLTVSNIGVYYTELDYGSCSDSNYSSNRVSVSQASTVTASITSSLGNSFCTLNSSTTLSTEKGNSYQWYKDNVLIVGATNSTYETNQSGTYGVTVNFGGCESKPTISLQSTTIKGSLNEISPISISQGETKTITVSTDVVGSTYTWFKNDSQIANATTSNLEVNEEGVYKVKLTHPSCPVSYEIPFEIKWSIDPSITEIPNFISPNNDGINDTWAIPQQYTEGNQAEVIIVSSNGEEVLRTNEYKNTWPESVSSLKNNNSVYYYIITSPNEAVKRGSITIVR
ncbi:MAG: gliding motility-associated C-terminal domain-containing protein [Flavobacterium sp.]|nr:gliding motility-associated C-terminal domain-containing protein [Flavobacterium sp.]